VGTDVDPLLDTVEKALAAVRSQDGAYEQVARECLIEFGREARKSRDVHLGLSARMLIDALRAPENDRRANVLDALLACRRTVLAGTP
jgi:hypothetical protein